MTSSCKDITSEVWLDYYSSSRLGNIALNFKYSGRRLKLCAGHLNSMVSYLCRGILDKYFGVSLSLSALYWFAIFIYDFEFLCEFIVKPMVESMVKLWPFSL